MSLGLLILTWLEPGSLKVVALAQPDALASWNAGAAKQVIFAFVAAVTKQGSPDFVSPVERIATFDNDGTLWCEQPMYVQFAFVLDRVKELAPNIPIGRTNSRSRRCSNVISRRYRFMLIVHHTDETRAGIARQAGAKR